MAAPGGPFVERDRLRALHVRTVATEPDEAGFGAVAMAHGDRATVHVQILWCVFSHACHADVPWVTRKANAVMQASHNGRSRRSGVICGRLYAIDRLGF